MFVLMFLFVSFFNPAAAEVVVLENKTIAFDRAQKLAEQSWTLAELNKDLPVDWSNYRFLVVEYKTATPQVFQVRLHTPAGATPMWIAPFQNVWTRAVLPLEMFSTVPKPGVTITAVFNKGRQGHFMYHWGPYLPVDRVRKIGIAMKEPLDGARIEVRSMRLANESPGDAILERDQPLVDRFGQWMRAEWTGKARSIEDLQRDWAREEIELQAAQNRFRYNKFGGFLDAKRRATGFFRTEKVAGKWWLVDPDGHLFWSAGAAVVSPTITTPTVEREFVFAELPPADLMREALGDGARRETSFQIWNAARRFGGEKWKQGFVDLTARRMRAWGFNTIGNWSSPLFQTAERVPYAIPIGGWGTKLNYYGLPDVYSPEFAENCDKSAKRQVEPRKNDQFLIGYFIGNEPAWVGFPDQVAAAVWTGEDTATRRAMQKFLNENGDTGENRKRFVYAAYGKMVEVVSAAVKRYDPNHLNLGIRFGEQYGEFPHPDVITNSKMFDVISINIYGYDPNLKELDRLAKLTGKPIVIGEFHFGVPERGMAAGLKQVRDQKERGTAYRYYVEQAAAHPAVVGTHYFQWYDQPNSGRFDGEDYQIGLMDVTDRPYQQLIEAARQTHSRIFDVHSGKAKPFSQKPLIQ